MTSAVERHPETLYFLTRATDRRECRLAPSVDMCAAFAVLWHDAAMRHGIETAALCVEPTHYHAVVRDPRGRLSDFLRDVHAGVARFGNALEEVERVHFWDGEPTHVVEVMDAQSLVDCVAYVIGNPVKDRLVRSLDEWPGLVTRVDDIARERGPSYQRPEAFFAADTAVSSEVTLLAGVPPMGATAFGIDGYRERVRAAVGDIVRKAHAQAKADGRGFMGVERLMTQSVWHRAKGPETRRVGAKARARACVAAASKAVVASVVERMQRFRKSYADARARLLAGASVVFPRGTWFVWRFWGGEREGTPRYAQPE